jgi:hypothetical protein
LTLLTSSLWALNALATDFGDLIKFDGSELYYCEGVTKAEAQEVGDLLVQVEYFGGDERSVQLSRSGDTIEIRFVIKSEFKDDKEVMDSFQVIGDFIVNAAFGGQRAEVHLCDDWLETLRVLKLS